MKQQIKFGTDGIRGKADKFPFTQKSLYKLGQAIAKWCQEKYKKENCKILLGHDTRISCKKIKADLIDGMIAQNVKPIDAQILPTPAVFQLIKNDSDFDCGIVISASHNPYTDNGIKLFDAKTGKLSKKDEDVIAQNYENCRWPHPSIKLLKCSAFTEITQNEQNPNAFQQKYIDKIQSFFEKNFLKNLKIILDCANGATYKVAPKIFKNFGAKIITIATNPNGKNINDNCGTLFAQNLQQAVLQNKADIGFAFDGDGDRVISINKNGEIKNGDDLLIILSKHPKYAKSKQIIGTVMTNHGLAQHLKKENKKLIRTKVGDKFVAKKIENENLLLGGESSGHIIINDYMNSGDGIFAALRTLESIIVNNNLQMNSFKKNPQFLINAAVQHKKDLSLPPFCDIIANYEKKLNNGRAIVRYSGTENLLRVMIEDTDYDYTKQIAQNLTKDLIEALN